MLKRIVSALMICGMLLVMCGCSGMFETEYLSVTEYIPPAQNSVAEGEKVTVRNFSALKQAIRKLAISGEREGSIVFDTAYDGDIVEDLASACWQLRTEDAFCAYCVDNIAYELNQIVSYHEANVYISYSRSELGSIVSLQYFTGAEDAVLKAFESGQTKLVLLINRSNYSADDMVGKVSEVYRRHPASAPSMPSVEVNMFSGTATQRLYEINLNYGVYGTELEKRREQIAAVQPFSLEDVGSMSELEKAYLACSYLMNNCSYTAELGNNSIYSALVERSADSEGMAYAFVELCGQLGVDCQMIYGQRKWQDHCWNIVKVDGEYYHVDVSVCSTSGLEAGFMYRDSNMWENYRWDLSSYPECQGSMSVDDVMNAVAQSEFSR